MDDGDEVAPETPQYPDTPLLRRRNSTSASAAASPTKFALLPHHNSTTSTSTYTSTTPTAATTATSSSSSFPPDDLELLSIKPASHSYTSLKDLLPAAAVNSPKPNPGNHSQPGSEICIRNRLVKQAAWAYLQPMSTSPGSAGGGFLHRLWPRFAAFFDFVRRSIVFAVDRVLRVLWLSGSNR